MMKRAPSRSSAATAPEKALQEATSAVKIMPVIVILVVVALVSYFVVRNTPKAIDQKQVMQGDPKQIEQLIKMVSQVVSVNTSEVPSVATIEDVSIVKAQNPVLYRDAKNGDRLLVWSDKAVVYSMSDQKVLTVMPLVKSQEEIQYIQRLVTTLNGAATTTGATTTSAASDVLTNPTVEVRNGTVTPGKARVLVEQLKGSFNFIAPVDANKKDYTKTVVYIANDKAATDVAQRLAKAVNGTIVTSLPGEAGLKGDIVVIIGE